MTRGRNFGAEMQQEHVSIYNAVLFYLYANAIGITSAIYCRTFIYQI